MAKFKKLQERVEKECLKNPKSSSYEITVDGKKLKCHELLVITNQLKIEIDKEITELKACEEDGKGPVQALAVDTGKIIEQSGSCKPSPDQNQCMTKFGCAAMAAVGPMKAFMEVSGRAFDNAFLKECSKQGNDCLLNLLRGIFDSIWSSLNLVWDLGKMAVTKTGELLGIVKRSEIETSERAMAAQQASPGFLKQMANDPVGTVKQMASTLYESLQEAAMEHYGCEKWAGLPFTSKCVQPMTTWNCASCAQKAQVYCGIGGYAVGEIATAFLTGGLVAGGKSVIVGSLKLASGPAKNVASFMSKTFPKTTSVTTKAGQAIGSVAKTTLTLAERRAIYLWDNMMKSKSVTAISNAASLMSKSAVGKIVGTGLKPIGVYLNAMDDAFRLGYSSVDNLANGGAKAVPQKVVQGAKLADQAVGAKEPTIIIAKDQAKATPGMVIVESPKPKPPVPSVESPRPSEVSSGKAPASTKAPEATPAKGVTMTDEDIDLAAQMTKYKTDDEYLKLYKGEELYPDHHKDVTAAILALEKTQPQLSKAEIRKQIESMMNSCEL
ncbi:hypothetical protein ACJVC5_08320 [Peredibacter sp. HCB2-198]|uniref:hypothetical protein n=1 Tax=Peredibacter sp. HCB2-198 TaxID=3383025 RepID=UPI0038B6A3CE